MTRFPPDATHAGTTESTVQENVAGPDDEDDEKDDDSIIAILAAPEEES